MMFSRFLVFANPAEKCPVGRGRSPKFDGHVLPLAVHQAPAGKGSQPRDHDVSGENVGKWATWLHNVDNFKTPNFKINFKGKTRQGLIIPGSEEKPISF